MSTALIVLKRRLDQAGIWLSALCVVHCLSVLLLVAVLGMSGGLLLDPEVHRIGLALAIVIGAAAIGLGAMRHGRSEPLLIGAVGLAAMAGALGVGHGPAEAGLTITGVLLVALAHWRNLRAV